jgi:hypothetical protein
LGGGIPGRWRRTPTPSPSPPGRGVLKDGGDVSVFRH